MKQKKKLGEQIEQIEEEQKKCLSEIDNLKYELNVANLACQKAHEEFENMVFFIDALKLESPFYAKFSAQYDAYRQTLSKIDFTKQNSIFKIHESLYRKGSLKIELYSSQIEAAIQVNINIREVDNQGRNIMHFIIEHGAEELFPFYFKKRVPTNIRNKKGELPVFTAVRTGNLNALKMLENMNFSFAEAKMPDNSNLLHYALFQQQGDIFKWLLNHVPKSLMDDAGNTPLYIAASLKNEQAVQLLLENGNSADLFSDDSHQHYSVLHQLIEKNNLDALVLIAKYADKKHLNNAINFHFTQKIFKTTTVPGLDSELPLSCALRSKNIGIIKFLLSLQSPYENLNSRGDNVFHLAAEYGNKEILDFLWDAFQSGQKDPIEQKRYLNQLNQRGYSPFHLAVNAKNMQAIEWFLSRNNVDKNQLTKPVDKAMPKQTALHLALTTHDESITKKLINNNEITLWNENSTGMTPFLFAKQERMKQSKDMLKEKIVERFLDVIKKHLSIYLKDESFRKILNPHEVEILISNIVSRSLHYIHDKNNEKNKKIRAIILNYHRIPSEKIEELSKQIAKQIGDKLAIDTKKQILLNSLKTNDFREFDQLLASCFSIILTVEIPNIKVSIPVQTGLYLSDQEVFDLKKRGFCRALGESLRYSIMLT